MSPNMRPIWKVISLENWKSKRQPQPAYPCLTYHHSCLAQGLLCKPALISQKHYIFSLVWAIEKDEQQTDTLCLPPLSRKANSVEKLNECLQRLDVRKTTFFFLLILLICFYDFQSLSQSILCCYNGDQIINIEEELLS